MADGADGAGNEYGDGRNGDADEGAHGECDETGHGHGDTADDDGSDWRSLFTKLLNTC